MFISKETMRELKQEIKTTQKIEDTVNNLSNMFKKHMKDQDIYLDDLKKIAQHCPESSYIKIQNGLIREQGKELITQGKLQQRIFGVSIFLGILLSSILAVLGYMLSH